MGDDIINLQNSTGEWRAREYKANSQNWVLFFILVTHIEKVIPFYKSNKKHKFLNIDSTWDKKNYLIERNGKHIIGQIKGEKRRQNLPCFWLKRK